MKQPGWFHELQKGDHGLAIRKDNVLLDTKTPYQHMEIFENQGLGRVMILDGCMMLTEKHEFTYHEMLVHPGLLAHPNPKRVLVIGGGDGWNVTRDSETSRSGRSRFMRDRPGGHRSFQGIPALHGLWSGSSQGENSRRRRQSST